METSGCSIRAVCVKWSSYPALQPPAGRGDHLETRIEINDSAERVWSLLTDFPAYPPWNPFIRSIEGNTRGDRFRASPTVSFPAW